MSFFTQYICTEFLKDFRFFPQFGLEIGFEQCEINDFYHFSTKEGKSQLNDWIQLEN